MIRFTALLAVLGAALVGVASIGAAPAAPKKLTGTVGPSETISLKKGSSRASVIPRGRYTIVVNDRSSEHNFHLIGPVSKTITSVSWTGTKKVTLNPPILMSPRRIIPQMMGLFSADTAPTPIGWP
jgi:hypothetical protein